MEEKQEKKHRNGWKRRFARLAAILTVCFNVMTTSLVTVGATVGVGVVAVAVIMVTASCQKEQPTQPQKHNVELKYDGRTVEGCVNIAMDTIYKYNADPNVDTIFMIPEPYNQFSTWDTRNMQSVVNHLRQRHNVNPNKVFGKGELKLNYGAIENNPEILAFFQDTLRYHVTTNLSKNHQR